MNIMKYKYIGKVLAPLFISMPLFLSAQTDVLPQTNSVSDTVEVVNVAFRKMDKRDVLGGVSTVNSTQLLDKNYTTYSLDNLDAYIPGYHGNIWGNNQTLVLVDGVIRDANNVLPTEIEEITVLKSTAAVALYGSRAAKGAVLITTKRGKQGDMTIETRVNAGLHAVKRFPKYLGSAEYMTLYNEARRNDGLSDMYSVEEIYRHAAQNNPYRYPNIDFYSKDYLDNSYNRYDATIEVQGGDERAKYYTNIGYYKEGSLLNFGEGAGNNNNRLNARGNVDVNITKNLDAFVDASLSYYNGRGVNADFFGAASTIRPNRFTPLIPIDYIEASDLASQILVNNSSNLIDGKYLFGGTQQDQSNAIATIYGGGTNVYTSRQFQSTTGIKANLGNILEGLTFQTTFGLDYSVSYDLSFSHGYATHAPTWTNYGGYDVINALTVYGQDASTRTQNISNNWFRQTSSLNSQLNYDRQFGNKHNVSAMVVAGGWQQAVSGAYHKVSSANLGFNASYNYDRRYYMDFTGNIVHSARLPEGNRKAFSPTISLGWRLSEESFLKEVDFIDDLRVIASGGILNSDLDITDFYLYEHPYTQNGIWYTWNDGSARVGVDIARGANPYMTFVKRKEINFGLEGAMFKNRLLFNGSFYYGHMTGMLVQRTADYFPVYFASGNHNFVPLENYNSDERMGFDFGVNFRESLGQVNWNLGLTATYYQNIALNRSEVYDDDYRYRSGKPTDALFAWQNLGFFRSTEDIDNSPTQAFGEVKPGDIKYKDQNGDGIVNDRDEIYLGRSGSPLILGANLTLNYKDFTFFAMGTFRGGGYAMRSNSYFWIGGEDKYSEVVRGRWTPETAETATFPRLTTLNKSNNFRNSDFWYYKTDRFDLSRVQISYRFPKEKFASNNILHGFQVYANGVNLFTISKHREIMELNVGSSPQTRFFNLGVKADF